MRYLRSLLIGFLTRVSLAMLALWLGSPVPLVGAELPGRPLIDLGTDAALGRLVPGQPDQATAARASGAPGAVVTCRPGKNAYPGIVLKPEGPVWDLSAYGHVEARVANTGSITSGVSVRVDNEGDWTANLE